MHADRGAQKANAVRPGCTGGKYSQTEVQKEEERGRLGHGAPRGSAIGPGCAGGKRSQTGEHRGKMQPDRGTGAGTHRGPGRSRGRDRAIASGGAWLRPAAPPPRPTPCPLAALLRERLPIGFRCCQSPEGRRELRSCHFTPARRFASVSPSLWSFGERRAPRCGRSVRLHHRARPEVVS